MTALDQMVVDLGDALPALAGGPSDGISIGVTEVDLELPVESRIGAIGLEVTAPRGRLATGFSMPHGRLHVSFVRWREPEHGQGGNG
jgi:hypothetical protein